MFEQTDTFATSATAAWRTPFPVDFVYMAQTTESKKIIIEQKPETHPLPTSLVDQRKQIRNLPPLMGTVLKPGRPSSNEVAAPEIQT